MRKFGFLIILLLLIGCEKPKQDEDSSVIGEWRLTKGTVDDGSGDLVTVLAHDSLYINLLLRDDNTFTWIEMGVFHEEEIVANHDWYLEGGYIYLGSTVSENDEEIVYFPHEYDVSAEQLILIRDDSWVQESGELRVWIITFYFDRQ